MKFRRSDQPLFDRHALATPAARAALVLGIAAALGLIAAALWLVPGETMVRGDEPVPSVIGLTYEDAAARLDRAGFRARLEATDPSAITPEGLVSWQDPAADIRLPAGTVVRLTRSSGPEPAMIPDVSGLPPDLAQGVIEAAGFRVGGVDSTTAQVFRGVAVGTRPSTGVVQPVGTPVILVVSRGPADRVVPRLVGLTVEEARRAIETSGLRVGAVRPPAAPGAIVVRQHPAAGARAAVETPVDLNVEIRGRHVP